MLKQENKPASAPIRIGARAAVTGSNIAPHLAYHDLRQWIEEARKLGEIEEVKGLSWQQDIGMVSEMALHDENAPCFIFEDIPGTIKGSRVLVNFFGGKRKNMTLGFPDRPFQDRAERRLPRPLHGRHEAHPAEIRQRRADLRKRHDRRRTST